MSLPKRTRRMALHHLRRATEVELNLIPLIDIMSVMVAFLLVYSADVEVIQNGQGVQIPQSIAEEKPKQSVVVMITKDQLFVQGELIELREIPAVGFFPDGTCVPFSLTYEVGGKEATLEIDPWTGAQLLKSDEG